MDVGGEYRNRTGVHGFAIRCVTSPPTRLKVPACYTINKLQASLMTEEFKNRRVYSNFMGKIN